MKESKAPEMQWAGIDLHVHTPASYDYEGSHDDAEYLSLIRSANEFGLSEKKKADSSRKQLISCIAFTDHNSVEGFCKWQKTVDETTVLTNAVRSRDPKNELVRRLETDLDTLRSVRVLMGVEINANPGIHLLLIFHESIEPDAVKLFLREIYGRPYEDFAGTSGRVTVQTLEETLDNIHERFGENVIVIAPHIENKGGIYEALKELGQLRMMALKHPALTALSFNKPETRERLRDLMRQGDYKRATPLAFIQSSDAHGKRGRIGQPRTDVSVPHGRPTFSSIRDSFRNASRVKCSVDFVEEEYNRLTLGETIFKYKANTSFMFDPKDHDQLMMQIGGILNSNKGVIELEGVLANGENKFEEEAEKQLEEIITQLLGHSAFFILSRELHFSSSRIKVVFKPVIMHRLAAINGTIYIIDAGKVRAATANEIESIVAQNIEFRFGNRFTDTLEDISSRSILLSRMPAAIPLLLRCREKFIYLDEDDIKLARLTPPISRKLGTLEFKDFFSDLTDKQLFGSPSGSCMVIPGGVYAPREEEHYIRYLPYRFEVGAELLEKFGYVNLETKAILIISGGSSHYAEPGKIISESEIFSLTLNWEAIDLLGILGWLKSSFFVWYTAVQLGNVDIFRRLQNGRFSFPFPKPEYRELYSRLAMLGGNIIHEERRFLTDFNRESQRGMDYRYREKLRNRHNTAINNISLSIDKEIYDFLGLSETDRKFMSETLRDLDMTDFGLLQSLKDAEKEDID